MRRFFNGQDQLNIDTIVEIYGDSQMGQLIHAEVRFNLVGREHEFVTDELKDLVLENHSMYGGSEHGFYYDGVLFCLGSPRGHDDIRPIDNALAEKAMYLKQSRTDLPQFTTYLAHYLSALQRVTNSVMEYVANCPSALAEISPSLTKLRNHVKSQTSNEHLDTLKFDREDKTNAVYFMHLDRISDPLGQFLFRRIAK